jgi:hypothetical protein
VRPGGALGAAVPRCSAPPAVLAPCPSPEAASGSRPGQVTEPDNAAGSEFCAVANASEPMNGIWGWADTSCATSAPFLCEVLPCSSYSFCATTSGAARARACTGAHPSLPYEMGLHATERAPRPSQVTTTA